MGLDEWRRSSVLLCGFLVIVTGLRDWVIRDYVIMRKPLETLGPLLPHIVRAPFRLKHLLISLSPDVGDVVLV
jgi:hypothetical protein